VRDGMTDKKQLQRFWPRQNDGRKGSSHPCAKARHEWGTRCPIHP
jgi:hypothetical protein